MKTLLLALLLATATLANFDRGFNSHIAWTNELEAGLARAKAEGKPAMVLIHKTWCGACKRLKSVFADSTAIAEAARGMISINLEDDEEPTQDQFRPDGQYIPRLFFVSPDGAVRGDIINEGGNPSYKYYYADEPSILKSMAAALKK